MVRGKPAGAVKAPVLEAGLRGYCDSLERDNALQQFRVPQRTPLLQLLGWALRHGVLTGDEVAASTPLACQTRPCYLQPLLQHLPATLEPALERYVVASSLAGHRGSVILGIGANTAIGARSPSALAPSMRRRRAAASRHSTASTPATATVASLSDGDVLRDLQLAAAAAVFSGVPEWARPKPALPSARRQAAAGSGGGGGSGVGGAGGGGGGDGGGRGRSRSSSSGLGSIGNDSWSSSSSRFCVDPAWASLPQRHPEQQLVAAAGQAVAASGGHAVVASVAVGGAVDISIDAVTDALRQAASATSRRRYPAWHASLPTGHAAAASGLLARPRWLAGAGATTRPAAVAELRASTASAGQRAIAATRAQPRLAAAVTSAASSCSEAAAASMASASNNDVAAFCLENERTDASSTQLWELLNTQKLLKQAFLPEYYPSPRGTPLHPLLATVMTGPFTDVLPPAPDWQGVFKTPGCWHKPLDQLASKYLANVKVHVQARVRKRVEQHVRAMELQPDTPRGTKGLLIASVLGRPRPLIAHNQDYSQVMDFRTAMGAVGTEPPPKDPKYSHDLFLLHLHLARYGPKERSYLPVVKLGRRFCYVDGRVAAGLTGVSYECVESNSGGGGGGGTPRRGRRGGRRRGQAASGDAAAATIAVQLALAGLPGRQLPDAAPSGTPAAGAAGGPGLPLHAAAVAAAEQSQAQARAVAAARKIICEAAPAAAAAASSQDTEPSSNRHRSLAELWGLTPGQLAAKGKAERRRKRQLLRRAARAATKEEQPELRRHERQLGRRAVHRTVQILSMETDGLSARLTITRPQDVRPHIQPLPLSSGTIADAATTAAHPAAYRSSSSAAAGRVAASPSSATAAAAAAAAAGRVAASPSSATAAAAVAAAAGRVAASPSSTTAVAAAAAAAGRVAVSPSSRPAFAGIDEGCVKLLVVAYSHDGKTPPHVIVVTRSWYYHEMRYRELTAYGKDWRRQQRSGILVAHQALSASGGLYNCDPAKWRAYLAVQRQYWPALLQESVISKQFAQRRMLLLSNKRSAQDRAANRVMRALTHGLPKERPLVIGVGSASFSPTAGGGALAAPNTAMREALSRVAQRERQATGRSVKIVPVWEHRTTLCCSTCGAETQGAWVRRNGVLSRSGRIRHCMECGTSRDRDVQGARNMLRIVEDEYDGRGRPLYLCRQEHLPKPPPMAPAVPRCILPQLPDGLIEALDGRPRGTVAVIDALSALQAEGDVAAQRAAQAVAAAMDQQVEASGGNSLVGEPQLQAIDVRLAAGPPAEVMDAASGRPRGTVAVIDALSALQAEGDVAAQRAAQAVAAAMEQQVAEASGGNSLVGEPQLQAIDARLHRDSVLS